MNLKRWIIISLIVFVIIFVMPAASDHAGSIKNSSGLNPAETADHGSGDYGAEIDFYSLLFGAEKDPEYCPGEKVGPEPEPEPIIASQKSIRAFSGATSASGVSGKEQEMVNYINQARSSAGLPPLQLNSRLTTAARAKSKDMAVNNYFSHNSPTYGSFTSLLGRYGISYRAAAENIAWNSNGSVRSAHNSLMNSAGHRNNIMNRSYQQIGVGIYVRNDGRHYYTQLFVGN